MDDQGYRYILEREWLYGQGEIVFILLNPSTADETTDDPTVRRCICFAKQWGYQQLTIINLFAMRSTDPMQLYKHRDPIGIGNDPIIRLHATGKVIAGWGKHGTIKDRDRQVMDILRETGAEVFCLGTNGNLTPKHPLYLRSDTIPQEYPGR